MATVLVTGAGRGLGLEFVRQYAADGWRVIGTVRDASSTAKLQSLGKNVEAFVADVADRESVARLAADLDGVPIDVLICNAGIYGPRGAVPGRIDYDAWEDVLRVNLFGPMAVAEALVRNVAASERKVIAMMSSRLGSIAQAKGGEYLYASSKAALNAVARALAIDLAAQGIAVVSLTPGWVRTDMGGKNAPLSPEVSVAGMRKVISGVSSANSGRFVAYDGAEVPW